MKTPHLAYLAAIAGLALSIAIPSAKADTPSVSSSTTTVRTPPPPPPPPPPPSHPIRTTAVAGVRG